MFNSRKLNKALKYLRLYNGVSVSDLAHFLKVTQEFVYQIEMGAKQPNVRTIDFYSDFFLFPTSNVFLLAEILALKDSKTINKTIGGFVEENRNLLEFIDHLENR